MKEVYQNRNGDKAPIFIISQFRRFIKANSKMPLRQFGRGGGSAKSLYMFNRNVTFYPISETSLWKNEEEY